MYSNIINLVIGKNKINIAYHDGGRFEFIADVPFVFKKHKDYIVTGKLNGIVGSLELSNSYVTLTALPKYVVSFYLPSEMIYMVNKFLKQDQEFDLNYCKHLRNTFSKMQFSETCLNPDTVFSKSVMETIEKLRKLASKYSTGLYSQVALMYYIRSEKEILYVITKGGDLVEKNSIGGTLLTEVPMYESGK